MMKRIKVIVTLVAVMLTISLQVSAQKRIRHSYRNVPQTVTVEEVIKNFKQYLEDIP